jgi:hypothetical protein
MIGKSQGKTEISVHSGSYWWDISWLVAPAEDYDSPPEISVNP